MRVLLVVYDNGSYIPWFPLGLGYIAAVLGKAGVDVEIYNQDIHHYPDSHLTRYLDDNRFDVLGYSTIGGYYQYRKLLSVARAVNASKNRPYFVLGGHGPAPEPEFFLKKTQADCVVIGEGELTVLELLKAIAGETRFEGVKGIAWREGETVRVNPRRTLIADIDSIPWPAYDRFPMEVYRLYRMAHCSSSDFVMPLLSGRGCTFTCNFCYRLDEGLRVRSDEAIVEEMAFLKSQYRINYILFGDELLMSSVERTRSLCEAIITAGLGMKWSCNGRLNYAKPDLLRLMKEAGCVFINYGIEAMDDQILKNMNKALTTKQIVSGIEATLAQGISPGFNIIFGNLGENRETLQKGVDFLLKYDDGGQMRTIRPVTPYPGSPLYAHAINTGLLKDCEDFYENKHLNSDLLSVNFTSLTDEEFHQALLEANTALLDNYHARQERLRQETMRGLYLEKDASFRGFRQS